MVRIPGTTFSDYSPKVDWEQKYHDLMKRFEALNTEKPHPGSCICTVCSLWALNNMQKLLDKNYQTE